MIKAVFFDCDGTLLSHRTNRVPRSVRRSFNLLKEKGIMRVLSTGRHRNELEQLRQLDGLEFDAWITVNGACTYDNDEIIDAHPVSDRSIRRVYDYLQSHELATEFFLDHDFFISRIDDIVIRNQEIIHTPLPPVGPLERILAEPVYLFVPFGIAKADEMLSGLDDVVVTRWYYHDAIDVTDVSTGKDTGMKAICRKYHIERDETIAFGDAMNDLPMLKAAGIGVAMGNGEDELKKAADLVTDDIDDDGVYRALVRLGILEGEL